MEQIVSLSCRSKRKRFIEQLQAYSPYQNLNNNNMLIINLSEAIPLQNSNLMTSNINVINSNNNNLVNNMSIDIIKIYQMMKL